MNPRVLELEALRKNSLSSVERAADALIWFSQQFRERGSIPRNIWSQLDRPLPRQTVALGRVFDVWHAVLRAEAALRNVNPSLAQKLTDEAQGIRDKLHDLLHDEFPTKHDLVVRLATDETYGTCNAFSAAAVLRSEVFPYRSPVTPSYLAGHILVAELKLAQRKATSLSVDGIRERAPRIAAVAQGVHSLMLYVDHLRARAKYFNRIAEHLDELTCLSKKSKAIHKVPPDERSRVEDAFVRIAVTAIVTSSEECGLLLLSTRPFFSHLDVSCHKLLKKDELNTKLLQDVFVDAAQALKKDPGISKEQSDGYHFALVFASGLYRLTKEVETGLIAVFGASDYSNLKHELGKLAISAARLVRRHFGSLDYFDAPPSIADSARFGFVEELISAFSEIPFRRWLRYGQIRMASRQDSNPSLGHKKVVFKYLPLEFLPETSPCLQDRLADLFRRYGLSKKDLTDPCQIVRTLGNASIGRSVLNWWASYSESYFVSLSPNMTRVTAGSEHAGTRQHDEWLTLRHHSFLTTQRVKEALGECKELDSFAGVLKEGAADYEKLAQQVQDLLKRLVQWCQARARDLLLASSTESGPVDPNELISALWVADRLGEPWREQLELEALRVIEELQRNDGGFEPAEPICQNRGFLFYASSAETLASIGRFVTRGGADGGDSSIQERLKRWKKVLIAGSQFLNKDLVTRKNGLSGWRSDRHPEIDRIDCSVTTEAVRALCRATDAYGSLLNLEASQGFSVSWPTERISKAIPADCRAASNQILPQLVSIVRDLRHRTGRYSPFIERSTAPISARRSLLFYGPPGTGKTYFQQLIAGELKWPLIILTIGDFLADGEDKVGARTAQIFDQLSYLSNTCIVFDEFDEMVIRRSPKPNHSGFDLLTPAMLPLLAALRTHAEAHNCLVTFTTNYVERLDRAAKRVGRVDEEIPLIYHDFTSRFLMFLKMAGSTDNFEWDVVESIIAKTMLCSYPEMRSFIERSVWQPTCSELQAPRRALDCDFYIERLKESRDDQQVIKEAVLVLKSLARTDTIGIPGWTELYAKLEKTRELDSVHQPVTKISA